MTWKDGFGLFLKTNINVSTLDIYYNFIVLDKLSMKELINLKRCLLCFVYWPSYFNQKDQLILVLFIGVNISL